MNLQNIEFYRFENEVWYRDESGANHRMTEDNIEVVSELNGTLESEYPEAHKALMKELSQHGWHPRKLRYRIVDRFIRCNFGNIDAVKDIDSRGQFNFEIVECPLRGICHLEGVVCKPKFNTSLGRCENEVMELWFHGKSLDEIAEIRGTSRDTVHTQIFRSYRKLGVHDRAEFVHYAYKHKLYPTHEPI